MKLKGKNRFLSVGVIAAIGIGVFATMQSANGEVEVPSKTPQIAVETLRLEKLSRYSLDSRFPGRVEARRRSDLGFERGGLLVDVRVNEGDRVEKGETLAILDTRALAAERASAQAAAAEASAQADLAQATRDRQSSLLSKGHISQQRFDDADANLRAAQARARAAAANVERFDVALELSTLKAPYSGIISSRMTDEGTILSPGTPIVRLEEGGAREFVTGVPADVIDQLEVGRTYTITLNGQDIPAPLVRKVPALDTATRTAQLVFKLPARSGALSGTVGSLALSIDQQGAGFWIPTEALKEGERGLWTVFVARPEGSDGIAVAEPHPVELLHGELNRVFVRGTLQDGDMIIASGLHRIIAGQRVRTRRASSTTTVSG